MLEVGEEDHFTKSRFNLVGNVLLKKCNSFWGQSRSVWTAVDGNIDVLRGPIGATVHGDAITPIMQGGSKRVTINNKGRGLKQRTILTGGNSNRGLLLEHFRDCGLSSSPACLLFQFAQMGGDGGAVDLQRRPKAFGVAFQLRERGCYLCFRQWGKRGSSLPFWKASGGRRERESPVR